MRCIHVSLLNNNYALRANTIKYIDLKNSQLIASFFSGSVAILFLNNYILLSSCISFCLKILTFPCVVSSTPLSLSPSANKMRKSNIKISSFNISVF